MSLVSIAARIIFTRLVRGQTIAKDFVLNSPLEPLPEVVEAGRPAIAVYTGVIKNKPTQRNLISAEREAKLELVWQMYFPPADAVGTPDEIAATLNAHQAGAGFALDMMQRQVIAALQSQNTTWSKLWTVLVSGYEDFDSRPVLIEIDQGVKVPCREVSLVCRTISDPGFGVPLNEFWAAFDAAMRADPALLPIADTIKDLVVKPAGMPEWRQVMAALGWSLAAARAAGLTPVDVTETGEPAELTAITVDPATLTVVAPPETHLEPAEDD